MFNNLSFQVTRPGFEPRLSEPESEVLPLYYRAIKLFFNFSGGKYTNTEAMFNNGLSKRFSNIGRHPFPF